MIYSCILFHPLQLLIKSVPQKLRTLDLIKDPMLPIKDDPRLVVAIIVMCYHNALIVYCCYSVNHKDNTAVKPLQERQCSSSDTYNNNNQTNNATVKRGMYIMNILCTDFILIQIFFLITINSFKVLCKKSTTSQWYATRLV